MSEPVPSGLGAAVDGTADPREAHDDAEDMRFERLEIQEEDANVALTFHRDLTVITGLDDEDRAVLVEEIVGSLGSSRPGVHLELCADNGTRFAIRRPHDAPAHALDLQAGRDVSGRFADGDGDIDLLAVVDLDAETAMAAVRLGAEDIETGTMHDEQVRRAGMVPPADLWAAAYQLRNAQRELTDAEASPEVSEEQVAAVERVEERHRELENAQRRAERVRRLAVAIGVGFAVAAVPTVLLAGVAPAAVWLIVAAAGAALSRRLEERARAARDEAEDALADAGIRSYSSLQLDRIDGLLDTGNAQRRAVRARIEHDEAARAWTALARGIDLNWALLNAGEIEDAASMMNGLGAAGADPDDPSMRWAQTLMSRVHHCRSLGPDGERLPLLLDEPFTGVDPAHRTALLDAVRHQATQHQMVLFTNDVGIVAWTRGEVAAQRAALVELDLAPASLSDRPDAQEDGTAG